MPRKDLGDEHDAIVKDRPKDHEDHDVRNRVLLVHQIVAILEPLVLKHDPRQAHEDGAGKQHTLHRVVVEVKALLRRVAFLVCLGAVTEFPRGRRVGPFPHCLCLVVVLAREGLLEVHLDPLMQLEDGRLLLLAPVQFLELLDLLSVISDNFLAL